MLCYLQIKETNKIRELMVNGSGSQTFHATLQSGGRIIFRLVFDSTRLNIKLVQFN